VDHLAGGHLALDSVEETDEFDVAVALHTAADHRPVEYAEGVSERFSKRAPGFIPWSVVGATVTPAPLN
jgi:hypothetical protein